VLPLGGQGRGSGIGDQGAGIGDQGSGISALTTIDDVVARLGQAPRIGTSSVRRIAQLTRLFPGAHFLPVRGNLDTRLRKLDEGGFDALVLAAAGLRRLGFASRISFAIPATACVPAPGQGIVAIEIREADVTTRAAVSPIDDAAAHAALAAEHGVVAALGGGCQTPIGALTSIIDDDTIEIAGGVFALDGSRAIRHHARGPRADAAALGAAVAAALLKDGAAEILDSHQSPVVRHQS
jgi:hydroxymethylbilane synthase